MGNHEKHHSDLSTPKYKILVCAPGSLYSTFDMYNYYLTAMQRHPDLDENTSGFAFHNIIEYHFGARQYMETHYQWPPGDDVHDIIRASRELILEVYLQKPDAVLFIDGSKYPPVLYKTLRQFIKDTNRNTVVACYLTEAPYIDDPISEYDKYLHVIFTNDYYDYQKRNPDHQLAVYYLPHSYSLDIHYPIECNQYQYDVFFCGTIFPERLAMIKGVDWSGVNAMFTGAWGLVDSSEFEALKAIGIASDRIMKNSDVADAYRASKIVVNFSRTFGWDKRFQDIAINPQSAFSMGPRVIEAAACGAFIVSEWRPEIQQVYGDSIPFFSSTGELEHLIRYYLSHEDERKRKAQEVLSKTIAMSYDDRLNDIVLPALQDATRVIKHISNGG